MRARLKFVYVCLVALVTSVALIMRGEGVRTNAVTKEPALALVVLYDGSGSMSNPVPNTHGGLTPKYQLANNAVRTIAQKIQDFSESKNVTVDAGLVYFRNAKVQTGIALGKFDGAKFQAWASAFTSPQGGTPLGEGIKQANTMLSASHALKKHILIVTDGESNQGEVPQSVLRRMKAQQDTTAIYFVAFDVTAKVFEPVKKLGATVVSAANEAELKTQIDVLLGKKILLEAE